ncbi:MAG: DUF1553 domain-containing protein [Planctomycetaceae bacterium]
MQSHGLTPAADADRATLLRRLKFDLLGLPPTPAEIDSFESDPRPDDVVLADIVDRYLGSPHFGERWGRHWLDIARYSDSTGGGRSMLYGNAWRYRDYVIDAFNSDRPFDQFLTEQIAGDLMPADTADDRTRQLTATAFLALGPTNYELQDKVQLRMDVVDEQIDTVGRAFLGMSLGCARCHDHKFDPIPVEDYYALAGIFRSTHTFDNGNVAKWVSTNLPEPPEAAAARKAHAARLEEIEKATRKAEQRRAKLQEELAGEAIALDDADATLVGEWTASTSVKGYVGDGYRHTQDPDARAVYQFQVTPGEYLVQVTFTPSSNRTKRGKVTIASGERVQERFVNQQLASKESAGADSIGQFTLDADVIVTLQTGASDGVLIADAVRLRPLNPQDTDTTRQAALQEQLAAIAAEVDELNAEQQALKASTPSPPTQVVSVRDEEQPEPARICVRGIARQLGDEVPRGFLQVVELDARPTLADDTSGRLELAGWMTDQRNPLTARVIVNRVWQHLFGVGLVRTVDNFGTTGETPSHPELLDHLAATLQQDGWSLKRLIRRIVLTRAYRTSSVSGSQANRIDPENRWLSHQNRRRLNAEALYDAMLSLSGQLDLRQGGETVRPGTSSEYGYKFDHGRRAVYLPVFRNRLPELHQVFDFPDPNLSTGKRTTTTLSTQALFLLNSPFATARGEATADSLLAMELTRESG